MYMAKVAFHRQFSLRIHIILASKNVAWCVCVQGAAVFFGAPYGAFALFWQRGPTIALATPKPFDP
jgi:hypothetical protein